MSVVQEIFNITRKLFLILQKELNKDDREHRITEINLLLEQREQLISILKGPYSEEEQKLGNEMIKYNAKIELELNKIKSELQQDLRKIKQGKITSKRYSNAYQFVNIDGSFIDKRN